ncbi:MAG: mechanosensitive ion channel family protein [Kiritimatiellia bacterium]
MFDVAVDWLMRHAGVILRIAIIAGVGYPLIRMVELLVRRVMARRNLTPQGMMLLTKTIRYGLSLLLGITILGELGFRLTAIIGAAGIAGVAIGFASQTSLSNLISGLFLIAEKPFQVGDVVQHGDTTGVVESIDLLSVKLRTFDNRFVRMPNESLVKGQVTNITRYPIRRFDVDIGVAYKEDVDKVIRVLGEVADQNAYCLDEPAPIVVFKGFGDSSLDFMVGVWFEKTELLKLRNSLLRDIKNRFDAEKIEIPFPHRSLYTGEVTAPFPIRIVSGEKDGQVGFSAGAVSEGNRK